ncbi:MAG: CDP-diacylglycerol--glycerol-3-phosphate 3-phosphatidyltransferase [Actinobacteria bacterium]|nr:CDP-diacylglycerol--glycerol-3-phosphate 3-phosphatidyltransferase [Actinomycetota bacterium]
MQNPNFYTLMRILLVPVFWFALFSLDNPFLAVVIFWVAAITDLIDGYLARKHNLISNFGKIADPIADKALTGAAWIGLSMIGALPWVATIVILVREVGITLLRLMVLNKNIVAADRGGKLKTTFQITTISFFLVNLGLNWDWLNLPISILLWITVAITTYTGMRYLPVLLRRNQL